MKDIFIILAEENTVIAGFKENVDELIRHYEVHDEDIDWKVIAKIPARYATIDISPANIDWYEDEPSKNIVDRAILSVIQFIKHG